jgi:hypothetical protein
MADRRRPFRDTVLIAMACLVAAGCATSAPGEPLAPAASSTTDRNGAPGVSNPLVATRFIAQPCTVLTTAQLASLDLGAGTPDTGSSTAKYSGPACTWKNDLKGTHVSMGFLIENKNGLADIYRGHADGQFQAYWEETSVDGYPGVFAGDTDYRKNGGCILVNGFSDSLAVLFDHQDRTGEQSCERVKQIVSMVIQTVRAGG